MSPFEHGEVFVLDDGGEVRFTARLLEIHTMLDFCVSKHNSAGRPGSGKLRTFPGYQSD